MKKIWFLLAILAVDWSASHSSAQSLAPSRPSVQGGFTLNPTLLPATVAGQSSYSPIVSNNSLRPQPAPFNTFNTGGGYLGGGYFLYYPPAYSTPVYNTNIVNVNLAVVPPDQADSPMSRINPLYGVKPVEPVSTTKARLILQVPTDAEVWVNGEKTPLKGDRRVFESPNLTNGKAFDFELKVSWLEYDKRVNEEKKFSLGAGESRTLIFLANAGK